MDIKAKLIKAFDSGKVKAVFDVTLDDKFAIHGVKLVTGEKGDFVSMPYDSWKDKNGQVQRSNWVHPLDRQTRAELHRAVTDAYLAHTPSPGNNDLPFNI